MKWPWTNKEAAPAVDIEKLAKAVAAETAQAVRAEIAGVMRAESISPMPGAPLQSLAPSPLPIYHYDHPIWWSTPQDPHRRPGSYVTVETLRRIADMYDCLRACIQHLKREVRAVPLEVVPKDGKDTEANRSAVRQADAFFSTEGGLGGFHRRRSAFEGAVLEDLIVIGAASVFFHPTKGGGVYQVIDIDAATIRPRTDAFGWPGPGETAYEQWIQGVLLNGYTYDQVGYYGMDICTRSYTPYPASPVEWLVNTVNSALNVDIWNQTWLTKGTTPADLMALPETWTPEMILAWQQHWEAMLKGDLEARQKTRFVPGGSQMVGAVGRKDQDFDEFSLWLLRRTCAIMGVQPASIGFAGEQYKVSQTDSMESTSAFGAGVLLRWRKEFYDDVLERLGLGQLEIKNVKAREEDAKGRALRNQILVGAPVKSINEARLEEGLAPVSNGDTILVPGTLTTLARAVEEPAPAATKGAQDVDEEAREPLSQWRKKAENRLRRGMPAACAFESQHIPAQIRGRLERELPACRTIGDVRLLFESL